MTQIAYSYDPMDPETVVLPIFGCNKAFAPIEFLGTGFVVGSRRLVATAYHNVSDWPDELGVLRSPQMKPIPLKMLSYDKDTDLALLDMTPYQSHQWFHLANDDEIYHNRFVICPEYSATDKIGGEIVVSMATRVGNITREFRANDRFGKAGEGALEVSFPALRGASGAPILSSEHLKVYGVIIANIDYHLIPAMVEATMDDKGEMSDEIKYMLPQGIAVHVKHLRNLLEG